MKRMEINFVYDLDNKQLKEVTSKEDKIVNRLVSCIASENTEQKSGEYKFELSPGAEIIFSTTVSDKNVYNWLQRAGYSALNRFFEKGKTRRIIVDKFKEHGMMTFGWTIIFGMEGGYTDLNDKSNNSIERSNKIILNNTPMEVVEDIATELCKQFKQQSVLIHDLSNNNTYKYWGPEE